MVRGLGLVALLRVPPASPSPCPRHRRRRRWRPSPAAFQGVDAGGLRISPLWADHRTGASALVVRLEPGERECFGIAVQAEASVSGNFELISPNGKPKPLLVVVASDYADEKAKPLYESKAEGEGTFAFEATEEGLVELCIANGKRTKNDGLARSVGFAIRVTSQHVDLDGDPAHEGSLESLLDVSEQLNEDLLTLTDHQSYMRRREETHKHTLESTTRRVLYWSAAESVVLVILAVWQVFFIRQFFETKRRI